MSGHKGDKLFSDLLEPYYRQTEETVKFDVNTVMNKPVINSSYLSLHYNNEEQVIDNTLFISSYDYNRIMKHHGTRTWLKDFPNYKLREPTKLILKLRNPAIFEKLEKSRIGRKIEPVYTFCVYDLFDLGPAVYIKRLGIKIRNKLK